MLVRTRDVVGRDPVRAVRRPTIKRVLLALREQLVNTHSVDRMASIRLVDAWLDKHR